MSHFKNFRSIANGIGFIATLLIFTLLSHLNWHNIPLHNDLNLTNGERFNAIEKDYDAAFSARQFAINLWGAAAYTLFNEGSSGIEIGTNNWFFTREEFDNKDSSDAQIQRNLSEIENVKDTLEQQGTELFIAVIPAKARVYQEFLSEPLPHNAQNRYLFFTQWLSKNSIEHVGLLETLDNAGKNNTFVRNDTHWSAFGAKQSAQAVIAQLKESRDDINWGSTEFETVTDGQPYLLEGDLENYLPLAPFFSFLMPSQPLIQNYVTVRAVEIGPFDEISYDVALVGTSYSAKSQWNFPGALRQFSGIDLLDFSMEGEGPFKPMRKFLDSVEFKEAPPKVVIWEIPERYLAVEATAKKGA